MFFNDFKPNLSLLGVALAGLVLVGLQSCSLTLDFDQCSFDDDCASAETCVGGLCQASQEGCQTDDNCEGEAICLDNICQEIATCTEHDDCPGEQRCERELCRDPRECSVDEQCEDGEECLDDICQELPRVTVVNHIVDDTTWTADNVYILENLIMVVAPAVLTIEPGTTILGKRNTGLAALSGSRLEAEGTRNDPIVFTSANPVGQRLAGDWAGLALVGKAEVNRENFDLRIIPDEHDARVGGEDDTWNCGTVKYVRIEFGGSEIDGQKALNGLTLAGCGSETTVEYVQSHLSNDDGIAVFGGTVDIRHIVSTRAQDDGFDFDTAWRGTAQYLAVQQDLNGAEGIEIENLAEEPTALPQTDARIYNFTLLGADGTGDRQTGLYFKFNGMGSASHGIVMGHKSSGLYIEGPEAAQNAENGDINVTNTLFYNIGDDGTDYFGLVDTEAGGFDNYAYFEQSEHNNLFGEDPGIENPYELNGPGWVPEPTHTTGQDIQQPPSPFDPTGVYRGAFSPSATPWTEGWTAYPRN
jgi:hypothetical protein